MDWEEDGGVLERDDPFDPVPFELAVPDAPKAASVGDLNGDGFNDLAVSVFNDNSFEIITDMVLPTDGGATTFTSSRVGVAGPPSLSASLAR